MICATKLKFLFVSGAKRPEIESEPNNRRDLLGEHRIYISRSTSKKTRGKWQFKPKVGKIMFFS